MHTRFTVQTLILGPGGANKITKIRDMRGRVWVGIWGLAVMAPGPQSRGLFAWGGCLLGEPALPCDVDLISSGSRGDIIHDIDGTGLALKYKTAELLKCLAIRDSEVLGMYLVTARC